MDKRNYDAIIVPDQGLGDYIEHNGMARYIADIYMGNIYLLVQDCGKWKSIAWMFRDEPRICVLPIGDNGPKQTYHHYLDHIVNSIVWWNKRLPSGLMNLEPNSLVQEKLTSISRTHVGHIDHYYSKKHNMLAWGQGAYKAAGLPYRVKFDNFYVERDRDQEERVYKKLNPNNEKYVFVHDDSNWLKRFEAIDAQLSSRHGSIKIIKNDASENPFHMLKIMEKAEEIHCMWSCLMHLIDCIAASPMESRLDKIPKFLHWYVRKHKSLSNNGQEYLGSKWNVIYDSRWSTTSEKT